MSPAEFLDIAVIVLLALVGGYGVVLNRRLNVLRAGQTELQQALIAFDESARRADVTLKGIESAGLAKSAELQTGAQRAQTLLNELSVMTMAGERIADRIEAVVRDVRAIGSARVSGKDRRAA